MNFFERKPTGSFEPSPPITSSLRVTLSESKSRLHETARSLLRRREFLWPAGKRPQTLRQSCRQREGITITDSTTRLVLSFAPPQNAGAPSTKGFTAGAAARSKEAAEPGLTVQILIRHRR